MKNNIYEQLKDVPPVPTEVINRVMEERDVKIHYFIPKAAVAALLIAAITTFVLTSNNNSNTEFVSSESSIALTYFEDSYSDSYDLLDNL